MIEAIAHSLTHSPTHPPTHSLTHSLTDSPTCAETVRLCQHRHVDGSSETVNAADIEVGGGVLPEVETNHIRDLSE